MSEISKTRMILSIRNLERRAAKIEDMPTFRGVPATAFKKEHLVMLCKLYANEWQKAQQQYLEVLKGYSPTYKARAEAVTKGFSKPSIRRRIWTWIKS